MTYEQACYYKLMLEIGLTDDFDAALDKLLEQEDPLSDLVLSLSTCGGDRSRQIHVLNEYVRDVDPKRPDRQAVFSFVVDRFRSLYEADPDQLEQITKRMQSVARLSGWELDEPWQTLYLMNDYYDFVSDGVVSKDSFMECFLELLYHYTPLSPSPAQKKQASFFKKIKAFFA